MIYCLKLGRLKRCINIEFPLWRFLYCCAFSCHLNSSSSPSSSPGVSPAFAVVLRLHFTWLKQQKVCALVLVCIGARDVLKYLSTEQKKFVSSSKSSLNSNLSLRQFPVHQPICQQQMHPASLRYNTWLQMHWWLWRFWEQHFKISKQTDGEYWQQEKTCLFNPTCLVSVKIDLWNDNLSHLMFRHLHVLSCLF